MTNIVYFISWLLIFIGCFFIITSAYGCLKFSDFYNRIHAASIGDSCGVPIILLGIIIQSGFNQFSLKIFVTLVFIIITSSTGSYSLAKSLSESNINKT